MGIALMSAKRSADPSTQVGCVIVKPDNRIVSLGYNGFPRNTKDGDFSWNNTGE
jgi:dCMP deaminase